MRISNFGVLREHTHAGLRPMEFYTVCLGAG